jgi:adenosylmethionine-8-amino-7-oxononanoate aminotransferase
MHLWVGQHRSTDQLPRVSCGTGCEIFDDSGKRYLDGSGGPALFSLGYAYPKVNDAIISQLSQVQFGHTATFTSDAINGLAELIAEEAGGGVHMRLLQTGFDNRLESHLAPAIQPHHRVSGQPLEPR